MINRNSNEGKAAQMIHVICAVCFLAFSFLYLYIYQEDLLAQEQYFFSRGETTYNELLGASLLTLILLMVGYLVSLMVKMPVRFLSFSWYPSCFLLAFCTSMVFPEGEDGGQVLWGKLILMASLYPVLLVLCRTVNDLFSQKASLISLLTPNLLILSLSFFLTGFVSNGSPVLHHELRMASLMEQERYEDALLVGQNGVATDRMTSMRAYSLLSSGRMANDLFTMPVSGGRHSLFPDVTDSSRVNFPDNNIYKVLGARPASMTNFKPELLLDNVSKRDTLGLIPVRDVLLCSYLLDKNLSAFVAGLRAEVDTITSDMPVSYREAVALYNSSHPESPVFLQDDDTAERLAVYQKTVNACSSEEERKFVSDRVFGQTYWHYFFFRN